MDSPVPLIQTDPDRSWITDPNSDHPKGTHPKNVLQEIKVDCAEWHLSACLPKYIQAAYIKSILLAEENQNFRLTENLQAGLTICTFIMSLSYINTAYPLKQQISQVTIPNMEARLATEEYGTKSVTNKPKPRIMLPVGIGHASVTLLP